MFLSEVLLLSLAVEVFLRVQEVDFAAHRSHPSSEEGELIAQRTGLHGTIGDI